MPYKNYVKKENCMQTIAIVLLDQRQLEVNKLRISFIHRNKRYEELLRLYAQKKFHFWQFWRYREWAQLDSRIDAVVEEMNAMADRIRELMND
jgi:hypothetical protein